MSTIEYTTGDATAPVGEGVKIIAHICNDIGSWGKGYVLAISKRWSEPESSFKDWHRDETDFELGNIQIVQVEDDLHVANMIGQHGIRKQKGVPPIRYEAVEQCLEKLAQRAKEMNASVHMLRIGCGLAGGEWEQIEPLIQHTLCEAGISVTVYDFAPPTK